MHEWAKSLLPTARTGRALEIGCGAGCMLEALDGLGWKCWGIEPSLRQYRQMPDHIRSRVFHGYFGEESFSGRFDLLLAFHVLEHVLDPVMFLKRCRAYLAPEGSLIVDVPNFGFACREMAKVGLGEPPPNFVSRVSPVFHVHHFTRKSLESAATRAGLAIRTCQLTAGGGPFGNMFMPKQNRQKCGGMLSGEGGANRVVPALLQSTKRLVSRSPRIERILRKAVYDTLGYGKDVRLVAVRGPSIPR